MVHSDGKFTSIEKTIHQFSIKANLFTFAGKYNFHFIFIFSGVECYRCAYDEALDQYDGNFADDIVQKDKS